MDRGRVKKLLFVYQILTFILSIYLLFSIVLDYTKISTEIKEINHSITVFVLWFFVIELIVLFFLEKNKKKYFKENWISIIAVFSSVSIVHISGFFVWIGSIFGVKAVKSIKIFKSIKNIKAFKIFKVAKTIKIGRKVIKNTNKAKGVTR